MPCCGSRKSVTSGDAVSSKPKPAKARTDKRLEENAVKERELEMKMEEEDAVEMSVEAVFDSALKGTTGHDFDVRDH